MANSNPKRVPCGRVATRPWALFSDSLFVIRYSWLVIRYS